MKYDKYYVKQMFQKGAQACDVLLEVGRFEWWDLFNNFMAGKTKEVTKGPCTHLAVMVKDGDMIEATGDGMRVNPLSRLTNSPRGVIVFRNKNITEEQKKSVLRYLYVCANLKVPYDYPGLVRFLCPWIEQSKSSLFCSEAGTNAFNIADEDYGGIGFDVKISDKPSDATSPNDAFRYLISSEGIKNGWEIVDSQNMDLKALLTDYSPK